MRTDPGRGVTSAATAAAARIFGALEVLPAHVRDVVAWRLAFDDETVLSDVGEAFLAGRPDELADGLIWEAWIGSPRAVSGRLADFEPWLSIKAGLLEVNDAWLAAGHRDWEAFREGQR